MIKLVSKTVRYKQTVISFLVLEQCVNWVWPLYASVSGICVFTTCSHSINTSARPKSISRKNPSGFLLLNIRVSLKKLNIFAKTQNWKIPCQTKHQIPVHSFHENRTEKSNKRTEMKFMLKLKELVQDKLVMVYCNYPGSFQEYSGLRHKQLNK